MAEKCIEINSSEQSLVHTFKIINAWVVVVDDDEVLSPTLSFFFPPAVVVFLLNILGRFYSCVGF
jgi:hypothetical protein